MQRHFRVPLQAVAEVEHTIGGWCVSGLAARTVLMVQSCVAEVLSRLYLSRAPAEATGSTLSLFDPKGQCQ